MATQRRKAGPSEEELIVRAWEKARIALEEKGVAGAAALGAPKLRPLVIERLLADGYELGGKKVRMPLEGQLLDLLTNGSRVPLSQLAKRLSGTTAAEAKKLAARLDKEEKLKIVVRGKELSVVPVSEPTLQLAQSKRLSIEVNNLLKSVRKAINAKPPATLLLSDLEETFEDWQALTIESPAPPSARIVQHSLPSSWDTVRGLLLALSDEDTGLSSVPDLAKRFRVEFPDVDLKALLLSAHRRGEVELRPEGGIARLSSADASLCPQGAGGLPLSWARLIGANR